MFLLNSRQGYFRCDPTYNLFLNRGRVIHIANLRMLFCRVPWGSFTRSPWSSRPTHLCRFTVRLRINIFRRFSWKPALSNLPILLPAFSKHLDAALKRERGFAYALSLCHERESNNTIDVLDSVPPSKKYAVLEY